MNSSDTLEKKNNNNKNLLLLKVSVQCCSANENMLPLYSGNKCETAKPPESCF